MIKIIAFTTMLIDHTGQIFFPNIIIFTIIGRLAFPLFAWSIANGFKRTSNIKKYALRLLLLAIISQFPYYLLFKTNYLNVCFTLLDGLLVIRIYESNINKLVKWLIISVLMLLSYVMGFEYGIYGVVTILAFYIFKVNHYLVLLQGLITIWGIVIYRYYPIQLFSVISTILVMYFEKYDFKINRAIQYGFYPIHIAIILLLARIIPIQ